MVALQCTQFTQPYFTQFSLHLLPLIYAGKRDEKLWRIRSKHRMMMRFSDKQAWYLWYICVLAVYLPCYEHNVLLNW